MGTQTVVMWPAHWITLQIPKVEGQHRFHQLKGWVPAGVWRSLPSSRKMFTTTAILKYGALGMIHQHNSGGMPVAAA